MVNGNNNMDSNSSSISKDTKDNAFRIDKTDSSALRKLISYSSKDELIAVQIEKHLQRQDGVWFHT
jgi:hypothetical protein